MTVFDPSTLDAQHWSAGLRITYTRPEQRSDAELEALAGQHIHAHNTGYNLAVALSLAYGITHHLTLSAGIPYVRRDHLREGTHSHVAGVAVNGVEQLGNVAGIGDATLIAKYRLSEGEGPGFALLAGIKLPTGSTHERSIDGEELETEHQPGTGSWDPIVGASASTLLGDVTLTTSTLYQWSTKGAMETRLGDRLQAGIALSHSFGAAPEEHDDGHDHHHHSDGGDEHHDRHATWSAFVEVGGEWEGRQRVAGEVEQASGGAWIYAAPGVRFSASGWSAAAALAVPLWQDIRASHPENRYRLTLTLGRAF